MRSLSTLIALATLARAVGAQAAPPPSCGSVQATPRDGAPIAIPVTIRSNHFVFTVCRGDRPLTFVLDTGAPFSIIDLELSKELGIETGQAFSSRGAGVKRDSVRLAG